MVWPANAMTWSNALCASRMLPSAARAISASAASDTSICSAAAILRSCSAITFAGMVRNSKTCERDRMVSGNLVQLRRRHHEDDVRRRLLDRLEQRVERVRRELMDLVDDEDLVAVAHRRDRPGRR